MKKKVLFVMNNLSSGGAEKSLSSLLQVLDYSLYDVDLLLFKPGGIFFSSLPKEVKLLEEPSEYKYFDMPIKLALSQSLKRGRIDTVLSRIGASFIFRREQNRSRCEQLAWKYISKPLEKIDKSYDVAIGYLEKSSVYFIVDKVKSNKKIGWIHTNYSNSGMDSQIDKLYFEKLDNIVTVSEECKQSLSDNFPHLKSKVKVIGNIISPKRIIRLSKESKIVDLNFNSNYTNIITVARLGYEKGIDLAIEACKFLKNDGYKVRWFVLGYGTEYELSECTRLIEGYGLEDDFQLLGVRENPYPYIAKADIYVQPSRYEGKSIAIEEAKILNKPIVVTNYSTVKDQIEDGKNGIIVDMDSKSINLGIRQMIDDKGLPIKLKKNLSNENLGTETEVEKLYKLIN